MERSVGAVRKSRKLTVLPSKRSSSTLNTDSFSTLLRWLASSPRLAERLPRRSFTDTPMPSRPAAPACVMPLRRASKSTAFDVVNVSPFESLTAISTSCLPAGPYSLRSRSQRAVTKCSSESDDTWKNRLALWLPSALIDTYTSSPSVLELADSTTGASISHQ